MTIDSFRGDYFFLSNFAPSPVIYKGREFDTVEHAYQAAKCTTEEELDIFVDLQTPAEAKKFGRTVKLRPDWEDVKIDIMKDLLRQKFHITKYRDQLLATGSSTLIEGNHHGDKFWGVCNGVGENVLGQLLMEIRSELVEELSH